MLFHFSEESDIEIFKPRKSNAFPELEPAVWAIDNANAVHYCLPRECPRVIYWKSEKTTLEDIKTFFALTSSEKIIVVESNWIQKIQNTKLYMYSFSSVGFKPFDQAPTAGYYINNDEIAPLKKELVGDLLERIVSEGVELRITPSLFLLRDVVVSSTLEFSIIRFRNAK